MKALDKLCDRDPILNLAVQELCLQGSSKDVDENHESLDRTMACLRRMAEARLSAEEPSGSPFDFQIPDTVYVPESPKIPGLYAAREPKPLGKLGCNGTTIGTHSFSEALQFPTKQECEDWIAANFPALWRTTEHGPAIS